MTISATNITIRMGSIKRVRVLTGNSTILPERSNIGARECSIDWWVMSWTRLGYKQRQMFI